MLVLPPLTDVLDLQELEAGVFEAPPVHDDRPRVFGGQIVAQALAAASFTVPGWPCHSLHGYFLLPGKPGRPIQFEVTELRDGKRFATRQVVAVQRDEPIFTLSASFQADAGEVEAHQVPMPSVPEPDALLDEEAQRALMLEQLPKELHSAFEIVWPIEMRHVAEPPWFSAEPQAPVRQVWFRTRDALPEFQNLHRCALAYASDFFPVPTCVMPLPRPPFDPALHLASLDHSVWFHRPFRADEWLLYSGTCDNVGDGRGLARAHIFAQDGTLVASVAQEGLVNLRP